MRYAHLHKSRTRARILDCARRLFARQGYAGTSIDALMADCGLTRGGFYKHFRSKAELYVLSCGGAEVDAAMPAPARQLRLLAADAATGPPEVRAAATEHFERLVESMLAEVRGTVPDPVAGGESGYFWSPPV